MRLTWSMAVTLASAIIISSGAAVAQRGGGGGAPGMPGGAFPLSRLESLQENFKLEGDKKKEAFRDKVKEAVSDGRLDANDLQVVSDPEGQDDPAVAASGTAWLVAWHDERHRLTTGADIVLRWIEQFPANEMRIGLTRRRADQNAWVTHAEVIVALHDNDGDTFPPGEISEILRHEIGHALGLGHARNRGTIMYPENTQLDLTETDKETLHLLYTLPPGKVK